MHLSILHHCKIYNSSLQNMLNMGRCHHPQPYLPTDFENCIAIFSHLKAWWECPKRPLGGQQPMKSGPIRYLISVFWEF